MQGVLLSEKPGERMPLVVENGTGVANADSFETVSECEAFALAYYGQNAAGSTTHKEAALRRAFYYMQALRWKAGLWPTFGGTIPAAIKNAQTLFARAELGQVGILSPEVTTAGQKIINKVDVIGWEVIGKESGVDASRPVITAAFDFLRPYLDYDPARDKAVGYTGALVV